MTDSDIERTCMELLKTYPGCHVKVTGDGLEMVAEITEGRAVAVIERSQPHFHGKMREVYRVLCGVLYVACGGKGHVLREGESLTSNPGSIHYAKSVGEPAWIEVQSEPPWGSDNHHVL